LLVSLIQLVCLCCFCCWYCSLDSRSIDRFLWPGGFDRSGWSLIL
jgi:hypothetical protein